jgi:hypothetical protein
MKLKQIAIGVLMAAAFVACNSTDATLGVKGAGAPTSDAELPSDQIIVRPIVF